MRAKTLLRMLLIVGSASGLSACTTAMVLIANQIELTELSVQNDKLYLMGELNSQTFDQVKTAVEANPNVETLVFTAMPESLDDDITFAMGRWLRQKGLNTHLTAESVIASGAVDLYLAGIERTMEDGAMLGVHSWSDGSKEASDFPRDHEAHDLNKSYIIDLGIPEEFYWFTIYQAPADEIYWMSEDEVVAYNLTTETISDQNTSNDIPFTYFSEQRAELLDE